MALFYIKPVGGMFILFDMGQDQAWKLDSIFYS